VREELREELRRVAVFTSGLAEMTRNRAEDLVRDWVRSDLRREQAQAMARDLLEWSNQNRKELTALVRGEIQSQLTNLGVVTRRDFDRLDRRVASLEESVRSLAASSARRDAPSRKATAGRKKSTRKQAAAGRKTTAARASRASTRSARRDHPGPPTPSGQG
jgi:polyhydroxyalkanoate synthesis regulator phasin